MVGLAACVSRLPQRLRASCCLRLRRWDGSRGVKMTLVAVSFFSVWKGGWILIILKLGGGNVFIVCWMERRRHFLFFFLFFFLASGRDDVMSNNGGVIIYSKTRRRKYPPRRARDGSGEVMPRGGMLGVIDCQCGIYQNINIMEEYITIWCLNDAYQISTPPPITCSRVYVALE